MKESYGRAAASSAAATPAAPVALSYQMHAMQHFCADEDANPKRAARIATIAAISFPDLHFCRMTRRDGMHGCIVEARPLLPSDAYSPACGVCPKNGVSVMTLMVRGNPRTIDDLKAAHAAWQQANAALVREKIQADARRLLSKEHMATTVESPIIIGNERDAWMQYTLVTFDLVRPHLMAEFHRLRKGANKRTGVVHTTDYKVFQDDYVTAFNTRTYATATGKGDRVMTPPLFCMVHRAEGHMFPVAGVRAYNPECWLCLAADAPLAPKDEQGDEPGFSNAASFRAICGDAHVVDGKSSKGKQQQQQAVKEAMAD